MMRILLLTPAFPPATGGIERTAAELAGGLRDHTVRVVAGHPPDLSAPGMAMPTGVTVHWARNDPPYGRRATTALLRRAIVVGLRFKPDVVLALHTRTMPAARVLGRFVGARTLLVIHAKEVREQPALARAAVRWADSVVAVSRFSRDLAIECGARRERVRIIHPGVTMPATTPMPISARPNPPTILTVARMDDRCKGHDVALAAMEILRSRGQDVSWVMVGDGSLRAELRQAALRRGLERCVSFPGAVDDRIVTEYLSSAHIFCMPSRIPGGRAAGEGFGIAYVEAAAYGLPVVGGDIPGVRDAVQDGVTGLLVDSGAPERVADALERLLGDEQLAESLGRAGRKRANELAWPRVVDRYRAAIIEMVSSPPSGKPSSDLAWLRDLATGPAPGT
jgi:phosphatidylinositol alpha-1,6-mannosyltransferase